MSFAEQTFERIATLYDGLDDFGPGMLYLAISELSMEHPELVQFLAYEASRIHTIEEFIEEGVTSNNQVFVEVFRRAATLEQPNAETERASVSFLAGYMTLFVQRYVDGSIGSMLAYDENSAANDAG